MRFVCIVALGCLVMGCGDSSAPASAVSDDRNESGGGVTALNPDGSPDAAAADGSSLTTVSNPSGSAGADANADADERRRRRRRRRRRARRGGRRRGHGNAHRPASPTTPPAVGVAQVWGIHDGDKIARDDLTYPGKSQNEAWDGTTVKVFAARNEVIAFQLIVQAGAHGAKGVRFSLPLPHPARRHRADHVRAAVGRRVRPITSVARSRSSPRAI